MKRFLRQTLRSESMATELVDQETEKYIIQLRRDFHADPELSFQEVRTSQRVEEELRGLGLSPRHVAGTGIIADLEGSKPGKAVGLRADMDALPIQEETEVPFKSRNQGVMHACGHDAHTAMLLGVAKVLTQRKEGLKGRFRFLFQPGEEGPPGGAILMMKEGATQGIDYVIGQHVGTLYHSKQVGIFYDRMTAANNEFTLKIDGIGGHASAPHLAVDALVIASQFVTLAQTIVSRRVDPLEPAVLTFGTFKSGFRSNVIASHAELSGTIRSFNQAVADKIKEELNKILDGLCQATGAKYELNIEDGYPVLINDEAVSRVIEGVAKDVVGPEQVLHPPPVMGAEDFGRFITTQTRGAYYFLGTGNKEKGIIGMNHDPKFDLDEDALKYGAEVLAKSAITLASQV